MKPAKSPSARTAAVPTKNPAPPGSTPAADDALPMPHERDQSVDMTPDTLDPVVKQAGKDVRRGVKDTSNGPEMDAAYARQKR